MKLLSIKIQNFRKFENFEISFDELNIIFGNNEAGKSTLIDAIISALFLDASTNSRLFFENSKHWTNNLKPILKLNFIEQEVEYELTRDFNLKLNQLKRLKDNKVESSSDLIKKQITTWLGIVHEDIFKMIGVLSGHEMAEIEDIKKITDALQKIITGGSETANVSKIINNLSKEISDMSLGIARASNNPGILRQLQDKIGRLNNELISKRTQFSNYLQSLKIKDNSSIQLVEIKKKIENCEEIIKNNELLEKAQESIFEIKNKIEQVQKDILETSNLQAQYLELERSIKESEFNYENYNVMSSKLSNLKENIAKIEIDKTELERRLESKRIYISENKKFKSKETNVVLITGLVFTIIISIIFILLKWWPLLIGSAIAFLILYLYPKFTKTNYETDEKLIEKMEDNLSDLKDKLIDLKQEVKNIFNQVGIKEENEFYEKKVAIESKFENLNQIVKYINVKLNTNNNFVNPQFSLNDLENYINQKRNEQDQLLLKKREIELAEVNKYSKYKLNSPELATKQQELDQLYEEKSSLEEQQIAARTRVGDSDIDEEKIKLLEEQYDLARSQYAKYNLNLKALTIAKETLEQAQINTAKSSSIALKIEVDKYLSEITNREYSQISINDKLEIQVYSNKKQDWISPEVLSTGTISQVYMLLKIAYFQLLSNGQKPPLFFDDPFITFDSARKTKAFDLLKNLVETGSQIILLTCDPTLPNTKQL